MGLVSVNRGVSEFMILVPVVRSGKNNSRPRYHEDQSRKKTWGIIVAHGERREILAFPHSSLVLLRLMLGSPNWHRGTPRSLSRGGFP